MGGLVFSQVTQAFHNTTAVTNVVIKATPGTLAGIIMGINSAGNVSLMDTGGVVLVNVDTARAAPVDCYNLRFSSLTITKTGTADITVLYT